MPQAPPPNGAVIPGRRAVANPEPKNTGPLGEIERGRCRLGLRAGPTLTEFGDRAEVAGNDGRDIAVYQCFPVSQSRSRRLDIGRLTLSPGFVGQWRTNHLISLLRQAG